MAVGNLAYEVCDPGHAILITWSAPFSLDVSDTETDITYCINISSTGIVIAIHTL